VVKHILKTKWS